MNYRKYLINITTVTLILMFLTGCPGPEENLMPKKQSHQLDDKKISTVKNKKLPDLSGGTESKNRTTAHSPDLSGKVFYKASTIRKIVALSFDDGPDEDYTPQILDVLKKNNVKATFFIMGKRAQTYPDMVRRIYNEGHVVGNHTWNHPKISELSPDKINYELTSTESLLYSIIGHRPALFRPPYGAASLRVIRQVSSMGYDTIDWSVDTKDWAGTPPTQIMVFVRKELTPGGILLEHCAGGIGENLDNTVKALPEIISTYKAKGYEFVTVPELLSIPAYKK